MGLCDGLRARLTDPESRKQLLTAVGEEIVLPAMTLNIVSGGRPPFAPLKPATLRAKARKGQPLQPMIATGRTLASLNEGDPDNVFEVDGAAGTASFGTRVTYAAFANQKRPFATLQGEDVDRMGDMTATWVRGDL